MDDRADGLTATHQEALTDAITASSAGSMVAPLDPARVGHRIFNLRTAFDYPPKPTLAQHCGLCHNNLHVSPRSATGPKLQFWTGVYLSTIREGTVLKLIGIILTIFPTPPGKRAAAPDLQGFATYSDLGTITSDPWTGWVLHEHPRLDP
jgi:hypothetical protein